MIGPAPQPQKEQHCEHEFVCVYFRERSKLAWEDGTPCMSNHPGCEICNEDTRSRPIPAAPATDKHPMCPQQEIWNHCPERERIAQQAAKDERERILDKIHDIAAAISFLSVDQDFPVMLLPELNRRIESFRSPSTNQTDEQQPKGDERE